MADSMFNEVELISGDKIYALKAEFVADCFVDKISLLIGAYKTEDGDSFVLPVVRKVEKIMADNATINHEYLPEQGVSELTVLATKLALGSDSMLLAENRVANVQSISGTGSLRLALEFLYKFHSNKTIYLSQPTWANHEAICLHSGYTDIREYNYYNPITRGLDLNGMIRDLNAASEGSIIILHACAHNPCGVDPSHDEWKVIADIIEKRKLVPLFDMAYQGFVTGELDVDAWAVRHFANRGMELIFCQSFAKNFGLYNERCGNLGIICKSSVIADNIVSQLKVIIQSMYLCPPSHGARIVMTILNDESLMKEWREQLNMMAQRILHARNLLADKIEEYQVPGDWSYIKNQRGMFSLIELPPKQINMLKEKYHIYMLPDGRINICGINEKNVDVIVKAFKDVVLNYC